jgi:hypothetical protein
MDVRHGAARRLDGNFAFECVSEVREELASQVRSSMWVFFYASIALAIQVSVLVIWSWPEKTSTGVLVNLYTPSFLAGCFWTTFRSEMTFVGTRTSRGIHFELSRRALPTFLLVTGVGALYSSPESRLSVVTYIESLSRLATLHLFSCSLSPRSSS